MVGPSRPWPLPADSDFCYAKLIFNGSHVYMLEDFSQHCNEKGLAESSRARWV